MSDSVPANNSFRDGLQWAWDSTSLKLAQECPRKYYYTMIEGWKPKELSVHLIFGQHYATALESFYKHRAAGDSIDEALIKIIRQTLIDTWNTERGEPVQFAHPAKTRFGLIRTIVWYIEEFGDESESGIQTLILSNGQPAVEHSFSLDLDDDIAYCGHLDRLVTYAGGTYVMDQKTTGSTISPHFFDQFKPDIQMSGYTYAGRVIFQTPVKGVIIDAAQIAVGFSRFGRSFTLRSDTELDEWMETIRWTIDQARSYTALGRFLMNLTACGNYGGCAFRKVCAATPRIRPTILKSDFEKRAWDPIERR